MKQKLLEMIQGLTKEVESMDTGEATTTLEAKTQDADLVKDLAALTERLEALEQSNAEPKLETKLETKTEQPKTGGTAGAPANSTTAATWDNEAIANSSLETINENWDDISAAMKSGAVN